MKDFILKNAKKKITKFKKNGGGVSRKREKKLKINHVGNHMWKKM